SRNTRQSRSSRGLRAQIKRLALPPMTQRPVRRRKHPKKPVPLTPIRPIRPKTLREQRPRTDAGEASVSGRAAHGWGFFFWNIQNARSFLRPANDHARRYGARWADWREPRSALGHNVPGLLYWNITGAI